MRFVVSASLALLLAASGAPAQQFFPASGGTVDFSKAAFADISDPANVDFITPTVAFTRANIQGLFNPLQEMGSSGGAGPSPVGTLWSVGATVQDVVDGTIDLDDFDPWVEAIANNPPSTIGTPAVVYLTDDDAYFDFTLTDWGIGGGGGGAVAYTRAVVTLIPEPGSTTLALLAAAAAARRPSRRRDPSGAAV